MARPMNVRSVVDRNHDASDQPVSMVRHRGHRLNVRARRQIRAGPFEVFTQGVLEFALDGLVGQQVIEHVVPAGRFLHAVE
jgi:hypothetical protein